MAFSMEENEPANPIDVNFFRSNGIAFRAQLPANAIKQLRRGSNNRIRGGHASDDVRWKRHGKAKKSTAGETRATIIPQFSQWQATRLTYNCMLR